MFADRLFYTVTYLFTIANVALRRLALPAGDTATMRRFTGLLLFGSGLCNVVEGIVDHLLLGIHHVNETAPREQWLWWDLGFLFRGAVMNAAGW